ncbi:hypothetical protein BDZ89DRAFT_1153328 [Hymenopellis radicata]|nr:hypothetical protein BDZ89DRAFT_1153328 [Hymenopellis radicata]
MAAIYSVYTSPTHPPIPDHLPTLIVTPHGQPSNILYSYLHTNFNSENYLLTPSPQGDLCVAKLFPPRPKEVGKASASDPGHSSSSGSRVVRCEASRNLKWSIANTDIKPNPNAGFWSMFYFAYAGHNIPPKRIEFGKIQKNPPGPNGGGTRISITGKSAEEKAVWQTLGEGNEDCVEWVVLCAALNLLDDEIVKAAEKNPAPAPPMGTGAVPNGGGRPAPVALRDPGPSGGAPPRGLANMSPAPQQRPPQHANTLPPGGRPGPGPGPGYQGQPMPQQRGFPPGQGPPPNGYGAPGQGYPMGGPPGPQARQPHPQQMRGGMPTGPGPRPPPQHMQPQPPQQARRF